MLWFSNYLKSYSDRDKERLYKRCREKDSITENWVGSFMTSKYIKKKQSFYDNHFLFILS